MAVLDLAVPDLAMLALAVLALAVLALAVLALAVLALAVPDLAAFALMVPFLAAEPALAARALAEPAWAEPALTEPALTEPALAEPALATPDLAEPAVVEVRRMAPLRIVVAFAVPPLGWPDRAAADRGDAAPDLRPALLARLARARAGRDGAAGLATDIVLAALVRALAAVVIALVALFIDCMAVDIVLADVVARVAAVVILLAAEVTLVAADETVRAALAGVGWEPADELRVLRLTVPPRRAGLAVVLRIDLVPARRAAGLPPEATLVVLVVDRPAERLAALVLTDRVLELAGLRRAVARAVVCTGTDFPPS